MTGSSTNTLCVISQPRYLPIISYIQRLHFSDCFVLLDVVQRQGRGWENRNKLLIPTPKWLSVPISSSTRALIKDTHISGADWIDQHKKAIRHNYKKHPYYNERILNKYYEGVKEMITAGQTEFVDVLEKMLVNSSEIFDIKINIQRASLLPQDEISAAQGPHKLLAICKQLGCKTYVSGANGRAYGVEEAFAGSGIRVRYHVPREEPYPQPNQSEFVPFMGFLDIVFCIGVERTREIITAPPTLED